MDNLRELETLLAQKRRLGGALLSFDGYDRWGAQHDTPENRARVETDAAHAQAEHVAVVEQLVALVARLRTEDPAAIERWADLHCELLRAFVATCEGAEQGSSAAVGAFVANEEMAGWGAVKRGEKAFVEENGFYVSVDRARYAAAFGVEA